MDDQSVVFDTVLGAMCDDGVITTDDVTIVRSRMERVADWNKTLADVAEVLFAGFPRFTIELARTHLDYHATKRPTEVTRRMICKALHHSSGFPAAAMHEALRLLKSTHGYRTPTMKVSPTRFGPHHRKSGIAVAVKCCPDNEVFDLTTIARDMFPKDPALADKLKAVDWRLYQVEEDGRAIAQYRREGAARSTQLQH